MDRDDDPAAVPSPAPHLVPAPEPWLEERDLPYLIEPGPDRACSRCGREDRRLAAEMVAARDVLLELENLLDWLREEHALANHGREHAEREALALRLLLSEFELESRGYQRVIERARKALKRSRQERDAVRTERDALSERVARFERYVAALEARLKGLAEAPEKPARGAALVRPTRPLARLKR